MTRALVIVVDSFGLGAAPDAARLGNVGAGTFGRIDLGVRGGFTDIGQTLAVHLQVTRPAHGRAGWRFGGIHH